MMQLFHNLAKLDDKTGQMLLQVGWDRQVFHRETLTGMSICAAIYLCDCCRQLAEDTMVRMEFLKHMIFASVVDAWEQHLREPRIQPHLALLCSAFCYYADSHQEFVLQGGVRPERPSFGRPLQSHQTTLLREWQCWRRLVCSVTQR